MSAFTVTRVASAAPKRIADRTDLNMAVQRSHAHYESRQRLQNALVADYKFTIATRETHQVFLGMMIGHVRSIQRQAYGYEVPTRALDLVMQEISLEMVKDDCDHYAACLQKLGHKRLYSGGCSQVANLMVEEDARLRKQLADVNTSDRFSGGLSSNSISNDEIFNL